MFQTLIYKISIVGWLLLGAIYGWSMSVHLWQAKYLDPSSDFPQMLFVVVGCMVLTAAYGARSHPEFLLRLITFPLFFAGLAWLMRPMTETYYKLSLQVFVVNFVYPVWIIPIGVVGGIHAIVFTRLRIESEATNSVNAESPINSRQAQ
jgi:hypothetical protein